MRFPKSPLSSAAGQCPLVVVQDHLQPCPYIDGETARMPLRLPIGPVTPDVNDWLLAEGYRRSGEFVYRTQCPTCNECKPTRVDVSRFRWSTSLRRVLNRGDQNLTIQWDTPTTDPQRVELFNEHRRVRSLSRGDGLVDSEAYASFLVDSCCDTRELSIYHDDLLVGISVVDVGETSLSAVYTHFHTDYSRYSIGTYAILKHIEWAAANNRQFVYLGMYVSENSHLNYKARFVPQQRLDQGEWKDVDES